MKGVLRIGISTLSRRHCHRRRRASLPLASSSVPLPLRRWCYVELLLLPLLLLLFCQLNQRGTTEAAIAIQPPPIATHESPNVPLSPSEEGGWTANLVANSNQQQRNRLPKNQSELLSSPSLSVYCPTECTCLTEKGVAAEVTCSNVGLKRFPTVPKEELLATASSGFWRSAQVL